MFAHLSPHGVIHNLRRRLKLLGVKDPENYMTHDFRRGHARDLQRNGAHLSEILRAGLSSMSALRLHLCILLMSNQANGPAQRS